MLVKKNFYLENAHSKKVTDTQGSENEMLVRFDNVDVKLKVKADSGAEVNLMEGHQFKAFTNRTKNKPLIKSRNIKLNTVQHMLEVKGEFQTMIRNETRWRLPKFIIVCERIESSPLIGKSALIDLGIMKIRSDASLA